MRYVTVQDIRDEIPEDLLKRLTNDDASKTPAEMVVDETKLVKAIAAAEAKVDSFIGKRYVVPLNVTNLAEEARALVERASLCLACYFLYKRSGNADHPSAKSYWAEAASSSQDTPGTLVAVARGIIELPGAEVGIARKRIKFSAPPPTFSRNVSAYTDRITEES